MSLLKLEVVGFHVGLSDIKGNALDHRGNKIPKCPSLVISSSCHRRRGFL